MFRASLLCVAAVVFVPAGAALASGPDARIRQMLETGFDKGPQGLNAALADYDAQVEPDPAVNYAAALVQLSNYRYRDAGKSLDRVVAAAPGHLPARRARIWLAVLEKQHASALAQIVELCDHWPQDRPARRDLVGFAGRMLGFLSGPAASSATKKSLDETAALVARSLAPDDRQLLDAAVNEVVEKYRALVSSAENRRENARDRQNEENREKSLEIAGEQFEIDRAKTDTEDVAAKVLSKLNAEVADIDRQLLPLNQEFARLATQGNVLAGQIRSLEAEAGRLRAAAARKKDEAAKSSLRVQADRLSREAGFLSGQYQALDLAARRVNAQRATLLTQRQSVIDNYTAQLNELGVAYKRLERRERQLDKDLKQTDRPATGNTASVRSLRRQATTLSTYDQLPLAEEKQRLLESLR